MYVHTNVGYAVCVVCVLCEIASRAVGLSPSPLPRITGIRMSIVRRTAKESVTVDAENAENAENAANQRTAVPENTLPSPLSRSPQAVCLSVHTSLSAPTQMSLNIAKSREISLDLATSHTWLNQGTMLRSQNYGYVSLPALCACACACEPCPKLRQLRTRPGVDFALFLVFGTHAPGQTRLTSYYLQYLTYPMGNH